MNTEAFLTERLGARRSSAVIDYLRDCQCELRISRPRVSKLGDFSFRNGRKRISINSDLNKYRFALTLVHEIAHLKTYSEFSRNVKPHGKQWQQNYRQLLIQFDIEAIFEDTVPLQKVYHQELDRPRACSGVLVEHEETLAGFDSEQQGVRLINLTVNQEFVFRSSNYVKLQDRRTRVLCKRVSNQRLYSISKAAIVIPI